MTLKSARIARAQDLTPEERAEARIPDMKEGLIILEIHNETLHEVGRSLSGGFQTYLQTLGDFNDVELSEEEDI